MPKAVIVGGGGQIGLATATRLMGLGWDVTIIGRKPLATLGGCRHVVCDAMDDEQVAAIVGKNTDLLMSCIAFDADDARRLLYAGRKAEQIIAVSSASVYRDAVGRTLDEARQGGFPHFPALLTPDGPTVDPGDANYSTRKVAMERVLLDSASNRATILRPCAIHGPHSRHAREWWFMKRLLDGCDAIPLAYQGESRFQTTSTDAIACAVEEAVGKGLPPIVNVSDNDSPSVVEIGRAIMRITGMEARLIGLPDRGFPTSHGVTPWSVPRPMICDSVIPHRQTYADAVVPALEWLMSYVDQDDWRGQLPQLAAYPNDQFDYASEREAIEIDGAVELAVV